MATREAALPPRQRRPGRDSLLLVAKLDRLSRNAAFLMTLKDSGVPFVAADMPDASTLTIGVIASLAQHEREMISKRTVVALEAARARVSVLVEMIEHSSAVE